MDQENKKVRTPAHNNNYFGDLLEGNRGDLLAIRHETHRPKYMYLMVIIKFFFCFTLRINEQSIMYY